MNKLFEIKVKAEILQELVDKVENEINWIGQEYRKLGTTHTNSKGEEVDDYDYVAIPEDELSEEQKAKIAVYRGLICDLEDLL